MQVRVDSQRVIKFSGLFYNISYIYFSALNWLVQGSKSGDVLFFSFSGIGSMAPDAETGEMIEYICPFGFEHRDGSYPYTLISVRDLMNMIATEKHPDAQLIILMDCNHASTLIGYQHRLSTIDGSHIQLQKVPAPKDFRTDRRQSSTWLDNDAPCRPRFLPPLQLPRHTSDTISGKKSMAVAEMSQTFLFCAADDTQAALEAAFSPEKRDILGLATWALHKALATALGHQNGMMNKLSDSSGRTDAYAIAELSVEKVFHLMNDCLRLLKNDPALRQTDQWISLTFPRGIDPAKHFFLSSNHLVGGLPTKKNHFASANPSATTAPMHAPVISVQSDTSQQHQQQQIVKQGSSLPLSQTPLSPPPIQDISLIIQQQQEEIERLKKQLMMQHHQGNSSKYDLSNQNNLNNGTRVADYQF